MMTLCEIRRKKKKGEKKRKGGKKARSLFGRVTRLYFFATKSETAGYGGLGKKGQSTNRQRQWR